MPVNPTMQAFLDIINGAPQVSMGQLTAARLRDQDNKLLKMQQQFAVPLKMAEDRLIDCQDHSIPIRVYTPEGEAPYPALVYYHGGGFVIGSIETHDTLCREIANMAHCKVISVGYRLAPEHKFPAAVEDAWSALQWVVSNAEELGINPSRIAVGGDSAGGNLAAVVCLMAKERGGPQIIHQLMFYPVVTFIDVYPSMHENAEGYFLTSELMQWFSQQYFDTFEQFRHPYASVLHAGSLEGLPSATILTAQYDPLRDQGQAYAEKLQEHGVKVYLKNFDGMIHAFGNFTSFSPEARQAVEEGLTALKVAFSSI